MIIVGTAGHVDHGKTTLVGHLTGIETDRLREEKERGISIELGFAYMDLPDQTRFGLVDVPGHERFVHQMIAGATGIDLLLLTVAADEGVMPQTREHVAICELLGMRSGLVILTKTDLVDSEWKDLVKSDLEDYLSTTFLGKAPILEFSATWSPADMATFRQTVGEQLLLQAARLGARDESGPFRLPVDRVFPVKGFGTVVTGTVRGGTIRTGDLVEVLPSARKSRVRRLESHGLSLAQAVVGMRAAVNLADIAHEDLQRGDVVATPGTLKLTDAFVLQVKTLASLKNPLKRQFNVLLHTGALQVEAQCRLLEGSGLSAGQEALIRVRTARPIPIAGQDRCILRGFSIQADFGRTIGGGFVVWPEAVRNRPGNLKALQELLSSDLAVRVSAAAYLAAWRGSAIEEMALKLSVPEDSLRSWYSSDRESTGIVGEAEPILVHNDFARQMEERVAEVLSVYHESNPRKEGMSREELLTQMPAMTSRPVILGLLVRMERDGRLKSSDTLLRLPSHRVVTTQAFQDLVSSILKRFEQGDVDPPLLSQVLKEETQPQQDVLEAIQALQKDGLLVRLNRDLLLSRTALEPRIQAVVEYLKVHTTASTPELKNLLNLSRKVLIPLLEYMDSLRLTRRVDENRRTLR